MAAAARQSVLVYQNARLPRLPLLRNALLAAAALLLPLELCLPAAALLEAGLAAHVFQARFVRELRVDPDTRRAQLTDYFRRRVDFAPADVLRLALGRRHASLALRRPARQFLLVVESRAAIKNELLFAEFLAQPTR